MSGTLRQKLEAIAAARFDGIELFENDFIHFNGSAARAARDGRRPRPGDRPVPAVPRFRGHARRRVRAQPGPRRAQVRPDAGARRAADAGVLEHLAAARSTTPRAPRRSCTRSPSAPRGATCASATRRWPGAATSTATRQAWEIVERADASAPRPDPRQLPHAVAARRPRRHRRDPGRAHLLPADGRRAAAGDGRAAVGAPPPQLPRPGPVRPRAFFAQVLRSGYAGPLSLEIFNDVFRETPNRRTAVDAMRSLLLPREPRRAAPRADAGAARRHARARARASSCSTRRRRRRSTASPSSSSRVDDAAAAPLAALLEPARLRAASAAIAQGRRRCTARARSSSSSTPSPASFARERFDEQGAVGRARSACAPPTRAARVEPRRRAALGALRQPARARRAARCRRSSRPAAAGPLRADRLGADGARSRPTSSPTPGRRRGAPTPASRRIDHIALGLAPDQLDTWILFSRAVLGLERRREPRARRPVRPGPHLRRRQRRPRACASCSTSRRARAPRTARR